LSPGRPEPVIRADEKGRREVVDILESAIGAMMEYPRISEVLGRRSPPAHRRRRIVVVAIGKAALSMSRVAEALDAVADRALIVVPHGHRSHWHGQVPWGADVLEAGHPQPDQHSAAAADAVEEMVSGLSSEDRVLALISGGGTALVATPIPGISAERFREALDALYVGGLPIGEVNAIRRGICRLAGGGLLASAGRAQVRALVLSDVPGDDPCTVASGPTCQLEHREQERTVELVDSFLGRSASACVKARFESQSNRTNAVINLVGTNADMLDAVRKECGRRSIPVATTVSIRGEARVAGKELAHTATERLSRGEAIVFGGETTVTVTGSGRGGRCQEFVIAAAAAIESEGHRAIVACVGTDGRDGPTDAAGAVAVVDPGATRWTASAGLALAQNDAYPLLHADGALVFTGPTHTNVMDAGLIIMAD